MKPTISKRWIINLRSGSNLRGSDRTPFTVTGVDMLNRKDVGYTIFCRLEESMRAFLSDKLINLFGANWLQHIPEGIRN